jgi:hypothetical protein
LPMLPLHDQGRGPWIFLHVVSGPWTSFVAALDPMQKSRMQAIQEGCAA